MLLRITATLLAFAAMATAALAQDGPRAYHLVPEDTHIISFTTTFVHAENVNGVFDGGVLTPSYRQTFDLFGNVGAILIGIPVGGVSASLGGGVVEIDTDIAQGDLFLGGLVGLVGSPSLSPMEYAQYHPGLRVAVGGKLYLPTGDYDPDRMINLGGNRWSLHAVLPISYVLGDTMLDPDLTTFEIVPSVHIFGDNDDPYGADVMSQDPVFGLQGHITHNFNPMIWASLDGMYEFGGETTVNGVAQDDAEEQFTLGATLGVTLSSSFAMRFSYEEVIYSSEPDTTSRGFQATGSFLF